MSEATRAIALSEAVKALNSNGGKFTVTDYVNAAGLFHTFLQSDTMGAQGALAPSEAAQGLKTEKSKATKKAAEVKTGPVVTEEQLAEEATHVEDAPEDDGGEAIAEEVTEQQVKEVVTQLIQAQRRDDAVKLLAQFKAKSVSQVKPEDWAAFHAAGVALLSA